VAPAAAAAAAAAAATAGANDDEPPVSSELLRDLLSAVDGAPPEQVLSANFRALGGLLDRVPVRPRCDGCPAPPPADYGSVWPAELIEPGPRSEPDARRRLKGFARCLRTSRTRTGARAAAFGDGYPGYRANAVDPATGLPVPDAAPGEAPNAAALSSDYYALKQLAFALLAVARPFWARFPQVDADHFAGPWLEDFVHQTFFQGGVRKNVTTLEFEFERELLGGGQDGVDAFADPWRDAADDLGGWRQSADGLGGRTAQPQRAEAAALFHALRARDGSPAEAIAAARAAGAPTVLVKYTFDYDLFYPLGECLTRP